MPFPIKDYLQIRTDILRDLVNQNPDAYTGADSDFAMRANASAASIEGLYEHQQWIARQIFPDTADSDILETHHANPRGIYRKAAAFATGTVRFSGVAGSAVPVGTQTAASNGTSIVTTAAAVVGAGGTVDIAAQAVLAGVAGNLAADTALTLSTAPPGILSQAGVVGMTGGTDIESDAALLARVLDFMSSPPMGGAQHDYFTWAMSVAGVIDAYIFTQRRAANAVDVVIETTGGLPSVQLIADVQAYIDTVRPVGADVLVMAPELVTVDIAAALVLSGITLVDATAAIESVLQTYFATLEVGEVVRVVKLQTLITGIVGVLDVALTSPAGNVTPLADASHSQIATLGTVTLT